MAALTELVRYADEYLRIGAIQDYENSLNGLQLENGGEVHKIGAAVDASSRSIAAAAQTGIDFLVVHHGMFWPGLRPITGAWHAQIKLALSHDLAIYSAHLPLDLHPVVGNNAQLVAVLGLENAEPFFEAKGQPIGLRACGNSSREKLVKRLENSLGGPVKMFAAGPAEPEMIGVVSGGAGGEIYGVAREGVDTFITGEAPHWAAIAAEELQINLLLGGHYATETFGVKAFAAHLAERFNLPWEFIDHPTGL